MSAYDDELRYREEEAMELFLDEQLRQMAEAPIFDYLAKNGDAIDERVQQCIAEAAALATAGFYGAALVRSAAGLEIAIRFYLVRPLVQGAFLSENWADLLTNKILKSRASQDRELLPAILRNWDIDISTIKLNDGRQMWEIFVSIVQPRRNDYVHKAAVGSNDDARLAAECLDKLLDQIVAPIAKRIGFTRNETGKWSVVLSAHDREINPPLKYVTTSPF